MPTLQQIYDLISNVKSKTNLIPNLISDFNLISNLISDLQSQMNLINEKMDKLIDALAEEDDEPGFDFDGNRLSADRDENEEL